MGMAQDEILYLKESMADILEVLDILHKRVGELSEEIVLLRRQINAQMSQKSKQNNDDEGNMYQ